MLNWLPDDMSTTALFWLVKDTCANESMLCPAAAISATLLLVALSVRLTKMVRPAFAARHCGKLIEIEFDAALAYNVTFQLVRVYVALDTLTMLLSWGKSNAQMPADDD